MSKAKAKYSYKEMATTQRKYYEAGLRDGAEKVRSALRDLLQVDRIVDEILERARIKYETEE